MSSIRRLYIYLVCAISLNAVTWAVITLLRHLLAPSDFTETDSIAFQIAVIITGLPIFLVHWLWAQRLAAKEVEERGSTLRYFYLFGMMTAFLIPFLVNADALSERLLWWGFGRIDESPIRPILRNLIPLPILAMLGFYQWVVLSRNRLAWRGERGSLRRLFVLLFSAAGVALVTSAVMGIMRFVLLQIGSTDIVSAPLTQLLSHFASLLVALPLWLLFWRWAQSLIATGGEEEQDSALRKLYLYGMVFVGVLTAVTHATLLLSGVLQTLLGLSPDGDWRNHLPVILTMGALWAYHATILRSDADQHTEAARQARVRRAYLYLVATIGLLALVGGIGGNISVLIRSLSDVIFDDGLRLQLAWFTAALIAGLPVWLIPWRQAQRAATAPEGDMERHAITRKAYLYFFQFLATLAVLSGVIYILWRLVSLLLGERPDEDLAINLAHAIAFALLGVGVWVYHGMALRADGKLSLHDQAERLAQLGAMVIDVDGWGEALQRALQEELPMGEFALLSRNEVTGEVLADVGLIVAPYNVVASAEIHTSPARKLLIPTHDPNVTWVGVEKQNREETISQTVRAVKQIIAGETDNINSARQLFSVVAAIVGGFVLLCMAFAFLIFTISGFS